jgi:hypothetical protein
MRTLIVITAALVYAVGFYSFGGAAMAQGVSAGAAKSVLLVHGASADGSSHVAMLSHPADVAKVIEEAAANGHRQ